MRNNTTVLTKGTNEMEVVVVKKRKLRPWVKVAASMILGGTISMTTIFGMEKTTYIDVEVKSGDTVCSIVESYNDIKTCDDLIGDVYHSNAMFYNSIKEMDEIHVGDTITIPVVEKRFIK